jgi:hypothetical protein
VYALSTPACQTQREAWLHGVPLVFVAATLLFTGMAWREARRRSAALAVHLDADRRALTRYFLACIATGLGALSSLAILGDVAAAMGALALRGLILVAALASGAAGAHDVEASRRGCRGALVVRAVGAGMPGAECACLRVRDRAPVAPCRHRARNHGRGARRRLPSAGASS